ncbi:MAG: NfeD family protein [Dehalococcoidia bacterium]
MRRKLGVHFKAFLLLLDEILIAVIIFVVLWRLGVPIPFWACILAGAVCAGLYWFLYRILLDQRRRSPVGPDSIIGQKGRCMTALEPEGLVRVQGETWQAVSNCGDVAEGSEVRVEDLKGLMLVVTLQGEPE